MPPASDSRPRSDTWAALVGKEDAGIKSPGGRPPGDDSPPAPAHPPAEHRFPQWRREVHSPDRTGLALSGGGIRSATFNLGLLHKLDDLGLLSGFDYVSTVSGGGYVGGFWSAWMAREPKREDLFPRKHPGEPEPEPIRHLREFSNFLRPQLALVSFSTGRILAGALAAVLPSVLIALAVVALTLGVWVAGAWSFTTDRFAGWRGGIPALIFFVVTYGLAQQVLEWLWSRRPEPEESRARSTFQVWALVSSLVAAAAWWGLWQGVPLPADSLFRTLPVESTWAAFGLVLLPIVAWSVAGVFLVLVRVAKSRSATKGYPQRTRQTAISRVLSRLLLCIAVWLVIGGIWLGGQWLAAVGPAGVTSAIAAALTGAGGFAWARRLFSAQPNKPTGGKLAARLAPWFPKIISYLTLATTAAATVAVIIVLHGRFGWSGIWGLMASSLLVVLAAIFLFDPQENGFHAFYRDRLTRAYLGASNDVGPPPPPRPYATEVAPRDDVKLDELSDRPLHLICCAANDLDADKLQTLHRGADSAVLSKHGLQVGDRWRRWETVGDESDAPFLSDAITASGAAVNSHMGHLSMRLGRAATFLLTALGLRLGLWVQGPEQRQSWMRHFPGLLFLRELFGFSRSRSSWVHLSDGGHFEHLALYELVRRRCRYVLLSDCGADPDVAFDDFGNAVRRVREDFGVEIEIDLTPLRRTENGVARQPMVAGTIRYPGGDDGVLLYVKPTLVGKEPEDVTQYERRNREFPHESTLDQFYDEAQWEAYRRLGEHVIGQALEGVPGVPRDTPCARQELIRVFLEARFAWPPDRQDDVEVLAELEKEWVSLEQQVLASGPETLRRSVEGVLLDHPTRQAPAQGAAAPSDTDLVATLPILQEALRLMHAVYLQSGIDDHAVAANHPRYMGWLNRFGRWASNEHFRLWWLWLSPVCDRSFVRFMVSEFELPEGLGALEPKLERVDRATEWGYTADAWRARGWSTVEDAVYLGWKLPLGAGGREMLVGIVEVRPDAETKRLMIDPARFFVPPGLWGIGIGERLLGALVDSYRQEPWGEGLTEIRTDPYRHTTANSGLWAGAGFQRIAAATAEGDEEDEGKVVFVWP